MTDLRVLEKGTQIIAVDLDVAQENILVVDRIEDADEAWKGQVYVCFRLQGGVSFAYRIPVNNVFDEFRQVHPSEMERVPWEERMFCTDDDPTVAIDDRRMYRGVWKRARWSGWAIPWFTDATLREMRALWHKDYEADVAKRGLAAMEDWEQRLLYDDLAGWCFWNSNLQHFEKLECAMAEIDGVLQRVWNTGCGFTWTEWTESELAGWREG